VYEVEVKFPVAERASLERRLTTLAARMGEPIDQVDRYFAHPARDFARTDEALRLRRVGDDVAITWKGPRIDATTKTRREIELPLGSIPSELSGGPPATIDRWSELLEALGFRSVLEVAKRRTPARVPWQGAEVDLALDSVAGLGEFVELELLAREGEVPMAQACILALAEELGCGTPERRSYLELLLLQRPVVR
jgi:adenylate cyclase class 2